jgi:cobalt-zinc-cadmium efflux system outer membrane protein
LQQYEQAQQQVRAAEQRVLTDVRVAYYEVLVAERRLELARTLVSVEQRAVTVTRRLIEAAETNRVTLLQTQLELANAQITETNANVAWQAAWRSLAALMGEPSLAPAPLAGDPTVMPPLLEWHCVADRVVTAHPLVIQAHERADEARWKLKRAAADNIPNVQAQAGPQYDYSTGNTIVGVNVALNIPLFDHQQGNFRRYEGEIVSAEQDSERIRLGLIEQAAVVFGRYDSARQEVERYQSGILVEAAEMLQLAQDGYEAGEIGYLAWLTAQRANFQSRLALLNACQRTWSAYFEIEGQLLTGSLSVR